MCGKHNIVRVILYYNCNNGSCTHC